jgi:hypothetical protein
MSWLSVFLRGGGKTAILNDLFAALVDGNITQAELQKILVKVGLGVVDVGLPGQVRGAYDLTDPETLRKLAAKNVDLALAEVNKVHILLGRVLEGLPK